MPELIEPAETPGAVDIFAHLIDIAKMWMPQLGWQRPPPLVQGKGSMRVRNGAGRDAASRVLCYTVTSASRPRA
jgi:hypothetical protein